MTFYECKHCGNIVEVIKPGAQPVCCGSPMTLLEACTTDASIEKHVPVYEISGNEVCVTVGEVEHPMVDNHYIEWIAIKTNQGVQRRKLKPGEKPTKKFLLLDGEKLEAVYAYCNIHSLWKK